MTPATEFAHRPFLKFAPETLAPALQETQGQQLDPEAFRGTPGIYRSLKPSPEQGLRIQGANFGSVHRLCGHPPHAQKARLEVKLLKHPPN